MTNSTFLCFLVVSTACLVFETCADKQVMAKTLLRSRMLDPSGDDKKPTQPIDHVLNAPRKILDAIDKIIPEPESTRKSQDKDKKRDVEPTRKPKQHMDPISIMRGELCFGRHDLIGHDKCMDWLVSECTTKSAGTGLCTRVRAHVKKKCIAKNEKACHYAKILGIDIPKEEVTTPAPVTTPVPVTTPAPVAAPAPVQEKAVEKDAKKTGAGKSPGNDSKAPAPAPKKKATAPLPKKEAPAPKAKKDEAAPQKKEAEPAAKGQPSKYEDPKAENGLQSQGFSGNMVEHSDGKTATADWGKEYGQGEPPEPNSGARSWSMRTCLCLVVTALACVSA